MPQRVLSKSGRESPSVPAPSPDVTSLLLAWNAGDDAALDRLIPLVERELRRLARAYMGRERKHHPLQATALVNEVFPRFAAAPAPRWQDRAHFIGIAATLMRRVLVDHARSRGYKKRGGAGQRVTLDDGMLLDRGIDLDLIALDRALDAFAAIDARKSRVVELRFFGGLSVEEAAHVLQVSPETIKRDWRVARLWLKRELQGQTAPEDSGRGHEGS
jgi:RNA polymerase sigma factor (TIGR02999 family)